MRKNLFTTFLVLTVITYVSVYYYGFQGSSTQHLALATSDTEDKLTTLEKRLQKEQLSVQLMIKKLKASIKSQWEDNQQTEEKNKVQQELALETNEIYQEKTKRLLAHPSSSVAVLVFSCNRISVTRCLDQLIKYRPDPKEFPILVTQDCQHEPTAKAIQSYGDQLYYMQQPDQSEIVVPPKEKKFKGYFKIARHYGWALNQTFNFFNFSNVIIIEDDLDVSPDIFEYFTGTLPLLQADPTLWCVSAWNDNGKLNLVDKNAHDTLYRTDFFPGLGWMLTKSLWAELSVKWPASYWDDWIRQPEQRKNRACIRPEISRTRTFGKIGVSNGLFYEKYLKFIYLNEQFVPFTKMNLTFLLKDNYDVQFVRSVYESRVVTYHELKSGNIVHDGPVRIPYYTKDQYQKTAKVLGLMDDFRCPTNQKKAPPTPTTHLYKALVAGMCGYSILLTKMTLHSKAEIFQSSDCSSNILTRCELVDLEFSHDTDCSGVPRTGYRGIVTFFYNKRRVYLAPNANWKGYDLTWS